MAITRCPYCHAIIDENVKYCNNCGTQLLFSGDENVEEEIPGEKILDAETEEKDYTIDEPEGEKRPTKDPDLEEDLEEELDEETEKLALDKLVAEEAEVDDEDLTEEIILVDEIEAVGAGGKDEPGEPGEKEETADVVKAAKDEDQEEDEDEDEEVEEPADKEDRLKAPADEETAEVAASPAEEEAAPQPVTFDTLELEGIGKTVELGKEQIDKFLEVLAKKEAEAEPPPKTAREPSGTLPPWASTMKGAPVFPDETGPVGALDQGAADTPAPAGEEEVEIFPRRRDSDSTIGLPERVSQSPLPFEQGAAEEEEEEEEPAEGEAREKIFPTAGPVRPEREAVRPVRESERREAEAEEEGEEPAPRPPFSFSVFFKSKAFDVLFVGLFWLVALWLAATSMGATLFDILGSTSGSMLLLYAALVFLYFFLFKFFLGETLGDRLFRERE